MNSICFLITCLHPVGGAEMQVGELAKALHKRGWRVRVVSMMPPAGQIEIELTTCGISLHSLDMQKGKADPRAILRLAKLIREHRPNILHSHMVHANLLARITRAIAPVPIQISTVHSIAEGGRLRELAYRMTDALADTTTAISEAAAQRYVQTRAVSARKMKVLPNGVDVQRFSPNANSREILRRELGVGNAFVWLAVGRFAPEKDYSNMLSAFARVQRDVAGETILLIAGDGPLRTDLEAVAARTGSVTKVRFLGFRSDTAALMNAADAYVMSSRWEGLPIVLLEASASALPIVATAVGGNAEIVHDGKTGFLVPPDDPAALSDGMLRLMSLPASQRQCIGSAGREHVVRYYGIEHIVDEWERLYLHFLQKAGRREIVSA